MRLFRGVLSFVTTFWVIFYGPSWLFFLWLIYCIIYMFADFDRRVER